MRDALNKVADEVQHAPQGKHRRAAQPLSSSSRTVKNKGARNAAPHNIYEAFAACDDIMSDLLKEYRNSKEYYDRLIDENGEDDPMCEIAADMVDSAKSALETRLIELKNEETISAQAIKLLREAEKDAKQEEELATRRQKKAAFELFLLRRNGMLAKARKIAEDRFFFAYIMTMVFFETLKNARRELALLQSFMEASLYEGAAAEQQA